ncbi:hypothetical protein GIW81_07110 [Hyphomicrobium sp. xq]|uniref:Uncharacterized protein n=1 Tax=Hyphomicrobium album TaxID=2665159 RepID=A0A6I3KJF3_9HYPH|nr:hypothetical protein [Hyphomicrobium album]MTD94106.1 hypothetical protein [Hyphomicrobium album]
MAQRKATTDDGKSQRQKFIDAAKEHGADADEGTFRRAVRTVATAPAVKAKKPSGTRKR